MGVVASDGAVGVVAGVAVYAVYEFDFNKVQTEESAV